MTAVFIRTAGERDLIGISSLLAETWHATYDAIYGPDRVSEITASWHGVDALRPRLVRPNAEFLVADDGDRLSGMAYAAASPKGRAVLLHKLYVRPSEQRRGLGGALLAELEDCFPEADAVRVEVEQANSIAIAFYLANGFRHAGIADGSEIDGAVLPAMLLEKPIG